MKFTSPPAFLALGLALSFGLGSCATPSNRRALYFPNEPTGPWYRSQERQMVAAQLNVPISTLPPLPPPASTPPPATLPNPTAVPTLPVPAPLPPPGAGAASEGPVIAPPQ